MNNLELTKVDIEGKGIKELIPVYETTEGKKVVDGRALWEKLKIQKDFSDWIKIQLELVQSEEGKTHTTLKGNCTTAQPNAPIEYILTLNIAKEICMIAGVAPRANKETKKISKEYRNYLANVEEVFKEVLNIELVKMLKGIKEEMKNDLQQMVNQTISSSLSKAATTEISKVKAECEEYFRPPYITIYNVSKYIKQRLGITKANEEYELVKQRIFIILGAQKWGDIPMEVMKNSMHIVDESIDVIKKDRPYSQTSFFDNRYVPQARM